MRTPSCARIAPSPITTSTALDCRAAPGRPGSQETLKACKSGGRVRASTAPKAHLDALDPGHPVGDSFPVFPHCPCALDGYVDRRLSTAQPLHTQLVARSDARVMPAARSNFDALLCQRRDGVLNHLFSSHRDACTLEPLLHLDRSCAPANSWRRLQLLQAAPCIGRRQHRASNEDREVCMSWSSALVHAHRVA